MDNETLRFLFSNSDVGIMALVAFWIKGMLKDIKKIDVMESKIDRLDKTIAGFSGELKGMNMMIHENNKDVALVDQKVKAAFKHIDNLNREAKL